VILTYRKFLEVLIEYSDKYGHTELHEYLLTKPPVVKVHNSCRRNYTSKRCYEQQCAKNAVPDTEDVRPKVLRSSTPVFDWKTNCFYCGEMCIVDQRRPEKHRMRHVEKLEMRDDVLTDCDKRGASEPWSLQVRSRLNTCCDLVAEEAVYHCACRVNFETMLAVVDHATWKRNNLSRSCVTG